MAYLHHGSCLDQSGRYMHSECDQGAIGCKGNTAAIPGPRFTSLG